jgi:3',5'-cyclic AMP phosphodiesterase CpdA
MKVSALLLTSLVSGFGQNCPLIENNSINTLRKSKPYIKKESNTKTKIAFFGDQGLGASPMFVLRMIKTWGADLIVHTGDFDYQDSPKAFMHQFTDTMGKRFPMLSVPGNHDIMEWFNKDNGKSV